MPQCSHRQPCALQRIASSALLCNGPQRLFAARSCGSIRIKRRKVSMPPRNRQLCLPRRAVRHQQPPQLFRRERLHKVADNDLQRPRSAICRRAPRIRLHSPRAPARSEREHRELLLRLACVRCFTACATAASTGDAACAAATPAAQSPNKSAITSLSPPRNNHPPSSSSQSLHTGSHELLPQHRRAECPCPRVAPLCRTHIYRRGVAG